MQDFLLQYENCIFTSILYHKKWISVNLHAKRLGLETPAQRLQLSNILDDHFRTLQPTEVESLRCLIVKEHGTLKSFCLKQRFALPQPTAVALIDCPRKYTIKTTNWVRERRDLDDLKTQLDVGEIVTCKSGHAFEGLITNFVVLLCKNDVYYLQTAPLDTVVAGTCLQELLSLCKILKLEIVFSALDLRDLNTWKGAFLTNAFRWVQPVTRVKADGKEVARFDDLEFILELQKKLLGYLLDEPGGPSVNLQI